MSENHHYHSLIQALDALPGVGIKAAERLAQYLVLHKDAPLYQALTQAQLSLQPCASCRAIGSLRHCEICTDAQRNAQILVLKTEQQQQQAEAQGWRGRYFILHYYLSPMQGVGPAQLGLEALFQQVQARNAPVWIALDATAEARATAEFIKQQLKVKGSSVVLQDWAQWLQQHE